MSTFGDELAAVLLHKMTGQGSQEVEQQAVGIRPADQAVHARNPMSAARATTVLRVPISRVQPNDSPGIPLFRGRGSHAETDIK